MQGRGGGEVTCFLGGFVGVGSYVTELCCKMYSSVHCPSLISLGRYTVSVKKINYVEN